MTAEFLIQSIHPDMRLDKAFFLQIYGYEISYPGFSDRAIGALEAAGCSKARTYYDQAVGQYQQGQDEVMRLVAAWYMEECNKKWKINQKEGEEQRKQKREQLLKRKRTLLMLRSQQLIES